MFQQINRVTRSTYNPNNKPYSLEERNLIGHNLSTGIWSVAQVVRKYNCGSSSAKKWKQQYEKKLPIYDHSHRPNLINSEHSLEVNEHIAKKSKQGDAVSMRTFTSRLQSAANKTREEENNTHVTISERYIHDYMKENDIHFAKAEVIDNAHSTAVNDPRHAASHAAMVHFLHESVPTGLYFNMDKTSFEID